MLSSPMCFINSVGMPSLPGALLFLMLFGAVRTSLSSTICSYAYFLSWKDSFIFLSLLYKALGTFFPPVFCLIFFNKFCLYLLYHQFWEYIFLISLLLFWKILLFFQFYCCVLVQYTYLSCMLLCPIMPDTETSCFVFRPLHQCVFFLLVAGLCLLFFW